MFNTENLKFIVWWRPQDHPFPWWLITKTCGTQKFTQLWFTTVKGHKEDLERAKAHKTKSGGYQAHVSKILLPVDPHKMPFIPWYCAEGHAGQGLHEKLNGHSVPRVYPGGADCTSILCLLACTEIPCSKQESSVSTQMQMVSTLLKSRSPDTSGSIS
jgi:hypothetical protein